MDSRLSQEDIAFRDEVRAFFKQNWTDDLRDRIGNKKTFKEATIEWQKILHKQGWIAPGWPQEYGGTGWNLTQRHLYTQERAAAGIPDVVPFGLKMVGPVIYSYGNEEQKAKFLPRILSSDDWWCQGYSEPGSGSDLASLKTRAERDGDHYVVNGQKIWTTYAQYADWIFVLVRTSNEGRPQQGISFILVDMKTPGITVRPIRSIDGVHSLNEVFFENVRVPVENLVGEENKGWTYGKALLEHERTGIAEVATTGRRLAELKEVARQENSFGKALIDDAAFRARMAETEIELMALEYTELRVLSAAADGKAPGAESSLLKIKGTQLQQAVQEMFMQAAGYYCGVIETDETTADVIGHSFASDARVRYMYGRAASIYGGSNEIQRNITSKAVLGL